MNNKYIEENKILEEKRKLIIEEIENKKNSINKIQDKMNQLRKESKGSYSQEKENVEKVYELLTKDIDGYEEAIITPYFGRVDFREFRSLTERIYIGKTGINSSTTGDEIVVDWRAPVADLYYSGTGGEAYYKTPCGVIEGKLELKRKFLFDGENIKEIFDETTNEIMINGEEGQELVDEFLKVNLAESRGKKLKEVVATIQKEQNEIIRWPKNLPIIVQGSAGSGKTTIALHRLAYLIYRYREKMDGKDILVLAPNKIFLDYISDILPSLGANEVKQSTFEELVLSKLKLKGKIYNKDEKLKDIMEETNEEMKRLALYSSKIRGTLLFKKVIDRYIALVESSSLDINDIIVEDKILFNKSEIMRLYLKDLKAYPINKRKDEIKRYLNLKIKEQVQIIINKVDAEWEPKINEARNSNIESNEKRELLIKIYEERDRIKEAIRKNHKREFKEYFKKWRGINSKDLYSDFLNNKELFDIASDNKISDDIYEYMKNKFNKNQLNNIVDEDDLAALSYIRIILEGIEDTEKYEHIVVDEAQDYSPFQIYLINKFAKGNSITLVGDLAQGIYYYKGVKKWEDITEDVFESKATYIQLTQSYRSTVEIIDFASGALEAQNLGFKSAKPVLRHGKSPQVINIEKEENYLDVIDKIIFDVRNKGKNSIGIITKDNSEAEKLYKLLKRKSVNKFGIIKGKETAIDNDVIIIPSYLTKGLEFDCTIIINPSNMNYNENLLDQRLLYVSLTRALHFEYILIKDSITNMIS